MSQTVKFKNEGFTDPGILKKALEKLGWTMVQHGYLKNMWEGKKGNDYKTRVWFTQIPTGQALELCFDGDYRGTMEQHLGVDFNQLKQAYRLELLSEAAVTLGATMSEQEVLEDGTIELELYIE